ncbi:nicotinate phosphoribosyltransferase-like [Paramacrobiotus metropolitanus]|uniref:nicotinate phosphoribosyltransferase-like n=1 Tax=Paramacrobiotus metropolitanus TaxID=2943436 RepID=UPI002446052C|nr:nicotinate phosphoribosyltransferase-like [Paramacrobiotus metropolitanus]
MASAPSVSSESDDPVAELKESMKRADLIPGTREYHENFHGDGAFRPTNCLVQPLLTDLYQITMTYAYWKSGKKDCYAVFDLFFRKNPFDGEFTIFCGLEECLRYISSFHFSVEDIEYIKSIMPATIEPEFFHYLSEITTKDIKIYAVPEGSVVFPREPLIRVEGPLPVAQLLETTLLTLVNYPSLVATCAARIRLAAGPKKELLEFGLRRAQGPDGGISATKYVYMGGFDGTSNALAGKLFNIPVRGTHAHSFVAAFQSMSEVKNRMLKHKKTGAEVDFITLCQNYRAEMAHLFHVIDNEEGSTANNGELAAFAQYAIAFPDRFLALVDTYDTLRSGVLNFCAVAKALWDLEYKAVGIRLDSGDLAYLSREARKHFRQIASRYEMPWFASVTIVASNDLNEETIYSLNEQQHQIDCFGVGTHLVTCRKQPALGCVFKLVELDNEPRIKLSQDVGKVTIPGRKTFYRLVGGSGNEALVDIVQGVDEAPPEPGKRILCRHPFEESKRANVLPVSVECMHELYFDNGQVLREKLPTMQQIRENVKRHLELLRDDHKRRLNPTPFKVSVSPELYTYLHDLWMANAPIGELY